jgi:membrane protease YdiL (CAAX protease family)
VLAALWQLRPFLVLAYGLTWVLLGPWFYLFNVVYQGNFPTWMVPLIPFAFIGGWGPSVAALIVTLWQERLSGVRKLVRSLGAWRVPVRWYLLALVVPPLVTAVSLLVVDRGATTLRGFDPVRALANLPVAYALALPFGPLGEELGWRGYALPRLLAAVGPVKASLTLGVLWTFWHVPMMLWSPGASIPSFMGLSLGAIAVYLVQITAITVLMTVLFLRIKGSVLLAVIAHLAFNTAESVLFGGLPRLETDYVRRVYLVNVVLLAALGLFALGWLSRFPRAASVSPAPA